MNPMLVGMAVDAVGKLVGGGQKQKYAKRYRAEAQAAADEAVRAVQLEKQEVKDLRAEDEARLKAATGYDLVKLRQDAIKAGFNPLTVLSATGGAGYDGRGAVLTTPFVSSEGAYARRLEANMGTGQAVIDGAGYVGDAIAGLGQSLVDYGSLRMQQRHEAAMLEASLRGNTSAPGAVRGTRINSGRAGSVPPLVGAARVTASPIGVTPQVNPAEVRYPDRPVSVNPKDDVPMWITARGQDGFPYQVWNDAAGDNEVMQGLAAISMPLQRFGAWLRPRVTDANGVGYGLKAARIVDAWIRGSVGNKPAPGGVFPGMPQLGSGF